MYYNDIILVSKVYYLRYAYININMLCSYNKRNTCTYNVFHRIPLVFHCTEIHVSSYEKPHLPFGIKKLLQQIKNSLNV